MKNNIESIMLIEQKTIKQIRKTINNRRIQDMILYSDPTVYDIELENQEAKYSEWIWNTYKATSPFSIIDISDYKIPLAWFHNHNKKLPENKRNIYGYRNLKALQEELSKYQWYDKDQLPVSKKEMEEDVKNKAVEKYETNQWYIIIPHTQEQQVKYGWNTQWCTQQVRSKNLFHDYYENGKNVIWTFINKMKPQVKYQVVFEFKEFKNRYDNRFDLIKFFNRYPEIFEFIYEYTKKNDKIKLLDYQEKYPKFITKFQEEGGLSEKEIFEIVKQDPEYIEKFVEFNFELSDKLISDFISQNWLPYDYLEKVILNAKNLSENTLLKQVKKCGPLIKHIQNPSEKLIKQQLESPYHPDDTLQILLSKEIDLPDKILLNTMEQKNKKLNNIIVKYILKTKPLSEISKDLQLQMAKYEGQLFAKFMENNKIAPSKDIQIALVKNDIYTIKYLKDPPEEAQLIQVEKYPDIIISIENPTEETQLKQVKIAPYLLIDLIRYNNIVPSDKVINQQIKKDQTILNKLKENIMRLRFRLPQKIKRELLDREIQSIMGIDKL